MRRDQVLLQQKPKHCINLFLTGSPCLVIIGTVVRSDYQNTRRGRLIICGIHCHHGASSSSGSIVTAAATTNLSTVSSSLCNMRPSIGRLPKTKPTTYIANGLTTGALCYVRDCKEPQRPSAPCATLESKVPQTCMLSKRFGAHKHCVASSLPRKDPQCSPELPRCSPPFFNLVSCHISQ